jgi:hypothetical protein
MIHFNISPTYVLVFKVVSLLSASPPIPYMYIYLFIYLYMYVYRVFQKDIPNDIANVTVWQVLWKSL